MAEDKRVQWRCSVRSPATFTLHVPGWQRRSSSDWSSSVTWCSVASAQPGSRRRKRVGGRHSSSATPARRGNVAVTVWGQTEEEGGRHSSSATPARLGQTVWGQTVTFSQQRDEYVAHPACILTHASLEIYFGWLPRTTYLSTRPTSFTADKSVHETEP